MNFMKKKIGILYMIPLMVSIVFASFNCVAQASQSSSGKMPNLSGWPEASRMAAEEMTSKYGQPDMTGEEGLGWINKGQWKLIYITKAESKHDFPIAHTDMLEQSISYKVPTDKYDELGEFDGSVIVDRTRGLLSARCDKEANNLLALNLAHDILSGSKSVKEARDAYGKIVLEKMNGGNPEYMQRLMFDPQNNSADADINTTGKSKNDMPKPAKKGGN
jgi:hypothetical protein